MTSTSWQQVKTVRRYYLLERLAARRRCEFEIADVFWAKQIAEPGVDLPANLPGRATLVAFGYLAIEDINGASTEELIDAGLTRKQATAALIAIAAL